MKFIYALLCLLLLPTLPSDAQGWMEFYPEVEGLSTYTYKDGIFIGTLNTNDGGNLSWGTRIISIDTTPFPASSTARDFNLTKTDFTGKIQWTHWYEFDSLPELEGIRTAHVEKFGDDYIVFAKINVINGIGENYFFRGIHINKDGEITGSFEFSEYDFLNNLAVDYQSYSEIIEVEPTPDGHFMVLGSTPDLTTAGLLNESWIIKVDTAGNILNSTLARKVFDSNTVGNFVSNTVLQNLEVSSDGSFFVSGKTNLENHRVVIRYDANGLESWYKVKEAEEENKSNKMLLHPSGDLYILAFENYSPGEIIFEENNQVLTVPFFKGIDAYFTKMTETGDTLWQSFTKSIPEGAVNTSENIFFPFDFCILNNGNIAQLHVKALTSRPGFGQERNINISQFKSIVVSPSNTTLFEGESNNLQMFGANKLGVPDAMITVGNGFKYTGIQQDFSFYTNTSGSISLYSNAESPKLPFLLSSDLNGSGNGIINIPVANLNGRIFIDQNQNCDDELGEEGIPNIVVNANNFSRISKTDGSYSFNFYNNSDDYLVTPTFGENYPYDLWESICSDSIELSILPEDTIYDVDFGYTPEVNCQRMDIDVVVPFLRHGFDDNLIGMVYRNVGTLTADSVYINIFADNPDITMDFPNNPYTFDSLTGIYNIQLGSVDVFEEAFILGFVYVPLSVPIGSTPCFTANIYPSNICDDPPAPEPTLRVSATCLGDSIQFEIVNEGAPMMAPKGYSIYADNLLEEQDDVLLGSNEVITLKRYANGATYHLETDPNQTDPFLDIPSTTIEACAAAGEIPSTGFINAMPLADELSSRDIECREVTAAIDPNDKRVSPAGVGDAHYVNANVSLEYMIRFQNTGTDTAFNIFVLDTLDANLDMSTFQMGAASHPYELSVLNGNVLRLDFPNILLPDSNVNEILSHGFFEFTIRLVDDVDQPYELHNTASIYFDYQPAVVTEDMFITVCDSCMIQTLPLLGHFIEIDLLLEGAYDGAGLMSTNLQGLIPLEPDYSAAPYFYNGKEELSSIPANMVDWVLIEARTGTPSLTGEKGTTTIETKAGLLFSDGSIRGVNGISGVYFESLTTGNDYYFCVRHRNHLDVLTASATAATDVMTYDFTTSPSMAWGLEQMKWLANEGKAVLFSGDFNKDGTIQTTDYDQWALQPAAVNVYQQSDANLDGIIQVSDFDYWFFNKAKLGSVEIGF